VKSTDEDLTFNAIGGPIPNRGFAQHDIELFGVRYLQQISDRDTGGAIHIEPGIWLNVPATTSPHREATVVRLATIPHGRTYPSRPSGRSSDLGGPAWRA
jgi:hypothetical protein